MSDQFYALGMHEPLLTATAAGWLRACSPLPREAVAKANELLKQVSYPIGTHIPLTIAGKDYLFAIEWHKHPPTDNVSARLKDWHRGVSVYQRK